MLKFFKRRRRPTTTTDGDNPLAIRNLLDQPALQALVVEAGDTPDAPRPSPTWSGLASAGPIRFDVVTFPEIAA